MNIKVLRNQLFDDYQEEVVSNGSIYEETRGVFNIFLGNLILDSVTCTEHAGRKTVYA